MRDKANTTDRNLRPGSTAKTPESHPLGIGVGAAVGGAAGVAGAAATGAAMGTTTGPVGAVAGAAIGAVVGGWVGKDLAAQFNPNTEEQYWRDNYSACPYVQEGDHFEQFAPAYRYGWESYKKHVGRKFEDVEDDLGRDWETAKGKSRLAWDGAKQATRDAWDHMAGKFHKS
jgi:hypothetical protein